MGSTSHPDGSRAGMSGWGGGDFRGWGLPRHRGQEQGLRWRPRAQDRRCLRIGNAIDAPAPPLVIDGLAALRGQARAAHDPLWWAPTPVSGQETLPLAIRGGPAGHRQNRADESSGVSS
jgi:hypothetical protein